MDHLDLYDVLAVASRVLGLAPRTVVEECDLDALTRILDDARAAEDVSVSAATLLGGFVRDEPFPRQNRLVAVAVVLQLAGLNGYDIDLPDDVGRLLDEVRDGRIGVPELARLLQARLRKHCSTTAPEEGVMFELFTDPARRTIVLAQEEACELNHNYVGTEHLLLGLLHEGENPAARVLTDHGITAGAVRAVVVEIIGRGTSRPMGHIPFTPRAKRVLDLTRREARRLGSDEFGPEHILLGLIAEGKGVASQAITKLGADPVVLRRRLVEVTERRRRAEKAVRGFVAEDETDSGNLPWTPQTRRRQLIHELTALLDENEQLHEENDLLREGNDRLRGENARLRALLEERGVDPDD